MFWKLYLCATAALILALPVGANQKGENEPDQYIKVEVKGILKAGLVAIGGETTGTTITARGATWELDFGKKEDLRKLAERLDGKPVIVTGTLEVRKGVEIRQRQIVTVITLKAADGK